LTQEKKKIVLISDNLMSTSGVACQSRYLAVGLAQTGKYKICQLGAAIKHERYDVEQIHPDIIVKPIDGFGDKQLYRHLLVTERPDAVVIFNDPRFFINFFEIHDEFHQICPIVYNHLWDQCEYPPMYNKNLLDAVDTFMCINRPTFEFLKPIYGQDRVKWAPHALPAEIFHPIKESEALRHKQQTLPGREDHFIVTWCNRNAHRKRPGDVMWAFKIFLDKLKKEKGHTKASLIMHTDPHDIEGPNLLHILELFKLNENVVFSKSQLDFPSMNMLYGISDTVLSISYAEGFGLSTLEALYCAKPIIAVKTGGLERQVVDYRDGSENGVALPVECKKLVGSQATPYIVEDMVRVETVAEAMWKMYEMGPEKRKELGHKAMHYAHEEFGMSKLIETWDNALDDTLTNWRVRRPRWIKKVVK
jgi:glycosyltransferase involved in cell wall biosynthesis